MPEPTTDNKEKEVVAEPNLPGQDPVVETKTEDALDPETSKWIKETGSLENAYKRLQGSKSEVERWRKEAEEAKKSQDAFQQQLAEELKAIRERDAENFDKLFGVQTQAATGQQPQSQPVQIDPNKMQEEISRQVRADMEVTSFRERHQDKIGDEQDWEAIKDIARGFVGKIDRNNKLYTIQTALMDATLLRHPDRIGDKAISEYLTASANRDSGAMPGDIPSGSSTDDVELTEDEMATVKNMTRHMNSKQAQKVVEGVKRRKAQRSKK